MGYHYNPQKYLNGFEIAGRPGFIWKYDKNEDTFRDLPIKRVANERKFYSDEDERKLTESVENPAQPAIELLKQGKTLGNQDRVHVAFYVSTMLRRVPRHRERLTGIVPQVLDDIVLGMKMCIAEAKARGVIDTEMEQRRVAEVEQFREKSKRTLPAEVQDKIRSPWSQDSELNQRVLLMAWMLCEAKGPSFFITSDNPVFFFEDIGFRAIEAEFIFPLSTTHLLHGSWQPTRLGEPFLHVLPQCMVKEFNRRIACGTVRFIFYHQKAEWIRILAQNPEPRLNLIRWQ